MERVIEELQKFNFSKLEAQIYFCLLNNGELNGSQISRILGLARTSVYAALDSLYHKGHINMLAGEPTQYSVQDPKLLVEKIKSGYSESIDFIEKSLKDFQVNKKEEQYWNIKGSSNIISYAKTLLSKAENDVYMSTNLDIQLFKEEINSAVAKGSRVIVFSFEELDITDMEVEFYHHNSANGIMDKRLMMVVDNKETLIANWEGNKEAIGTFSQNTLMVSIIAEHIHHDIYLLKLKNKYNKNMIDKDILIDSNFENKSVFCKDKKNK